MSPIWIALCLSGLLDVSTLAVSPPENETWIVEVEAGRFGRHDAIVIWDRPESAGLPRAWGVDGSDGETIGFARSEVAGERGSLIRWVIPGMLRAGEVRWCRLTAVANEDAPKGWAIHQIPAGLESRRYDDPVFRYHKDLADPPAGVDSVYARSGFIHPLWTPQGRVLTGDSPPAHRHQRGIFSAWTKTTFEGRTIDFWNIAKREGTTEASMGRLLQVGPVLSGFESVHSHLDRTDSESPRVTATESWSVVALRAGGRNVVDVTTSQRAAGRSPLVVEEYTYGGFAWRGPESWMPQACVFFTDTSDDRVSANELRPRWVAATGEVDGSDVTFVILSHPGNFRGPQPVRIHPEEPYFCFAPCELGPFEIGDDPVESRYRMIAADGRLDRATIDGLYVDYVFPVRVRVVR